MFKQLRHYVPSAVDEVFTRQNNPAGNEDAVSLWSFDIFHISTTNLENELMLAAVPVA